MLVLVAIGAVVALLYFLPSLLAFLRSKRNAPAIFALNLFLGWTFLGWVGSLVWSLLSDPIAPLGSAADLAASVGTGTSRRDWAYVAPGPTPTAERTALAVLRRFASKPAISNIVAVVGAVVLLFAFQPITGIAHAYFEPVAQQHISSIASYLGMPINVVAAATDLVINVASFSAGLLVIWLLSRTTDRYFLGPRARPSGSRIGLSAQEPRAGGNEGVNAPGT